VTGSGRYWVCSSQQISANANSGWAFTGWSDGKHRTILARSQCRLVAQPIRRASRKTCRDRSAGESLLLVGALVVLAPIWLALMSDFGGCEQLLDVHKLERRQRTEPAHDHSAGRWCAVHRELPAGIWNDHGGGESSEWWHRQRRRFIPVRFFAADLCQCEQWLDFTGWGDGNSSNPRTITVPSGGATYRCHFPSPI